MQRGIRGRVREPFPSSGNQVLRCRLRGGNGRALLASQRGAEVCGVDAAGSLLGIARERVVGGDFRLGDLEALPFPDGTFDVATGFNSFQFAATPVAALIWKPGEFRSPPVESWC